MASPLQRLVAWYSSHCDDNWEHSYGFDIGTLDNPGVSLDVDLLGTSLETAPFTEVRHDMDLPNKWIVCRRTKERFEGRGAPGRIEDIILAFLEWSDRHPSPSNDPRDPTA